MKLLTKPDFTKREFEVEVQDSCGNIYIVPIVVDDKARYSHVNFLHGHIFIRKNSPNPFLELLHEIHHLDKNITAPFWAPQIKHGSILHEVISDTKGERTREQIIETVDSLIIDDKLKKVIEVIITSQELGSVDNMVEDNRIFEHLRVEHGISIEEVLKLHESHLDVYKGIEIIANRSEDIFGKFGKGLVKVGENLRRIDDLKERINLFYLHLDIVNAFSIKKPILEYFDEHVSYLKSIRLKGKSLISEVFNLKVREEVRRIKVCRDTFEDPEYRVNAAKELLRGKLHDHDLIHKTQRVLQVKIYWRGFREPLITV